MNEFKTKVADAGYSITFETYDRKAYEQVQNLCRLLVDGKDGGAIPIEWIKNWMAKSENTYNREQVYEMLEDWEKENEHKESD